MGSGCGTIDSTVASNSRELGFEYRLKESTTQSNVLKLGSSL